MIRHNSCCAAKRSLAANKRRALIQMATGSGKTYTAVNFVYRLIKLAGARRVLFLEDSANLPDPDIIAAEIVEDLQAALAQFAEIAADLKR
jgi:type I site-specific restriction endonuclease